jgi:DsbC/DsbD-like thiol-disulfide interchange protein
MRQALKILLAGFVFCGLFVPVASQQPQEETLNPVRWSLKIKPAHKAFKVGETLQVQLTAQIEDGWHLYSLDEIPNGPRPTRFTLPDGQAFALAGDIQQPIPHVKLDENFGVETPYFAETVTFQMPLKITSSSRSGTTPLLIQARYQTCNEQLCLPPKTVRLAAQVKIK